MNRRLFLAVVMLACGCTPHSDKVAPATSPMRIISTLPSITEVLFDIGLGDRIIGDSSFTKYPPETAGIEKIGGLYDLNREKIIALKPDIIILSVESESLCRTLNIPALIVDHRTLSGVIDSYTIIGSHFGKESAAQRKRLELLSRLNQFETKIKKRTNPIPTLICIDRSYGTGQIQNLFVAGKDSFLSEAVIKAGGENVAASLGLSAPMLSTEGIIQLAPEVIIDIQISGRNVKQSQADWQNLGDKVPAVKHRRILTLSDDFASIPGPRTPLLIEKIAEYYETLYEE